MFYKDVEFSRRVSCTVLDCKDYGRIVLDSHTHVLPGTTFRSSVTINERGGKQSVSNYFFRGLPIKAIMGVAKVLKEGANRYERGDDGTKDPYKDIANRNWHKISSEEHLEHLMEHIIKFLDGDTSEFHPGHIATRALFFLHMYYVERNLTP